VVSAVLLPTESEALVLKPDFSTAIRDRRQGVMKSAYENLEQKGLLRSVSMEQNPESWRIVIYTGSGMAIGAALGLLFSLMLFENVIAGPLAGVVVGAVIGMIWELQSKRRRTR